MDPLGPIGDGHTEVPEERREQLIPTYIATLGDLYEAEEANIANGTYGRAPTPTQLLDDLYLRELHHAMFDQVWRWAGRHRQHDVNIGGVDPIDVPIPASRTVGSVLLYEGEFDAAWDTAAAPVPVGGRAMLAG